MSQIPSNILEHFYRQTHGLIGLYPIPAEAFATDDFETYCALRSILYPDAWPVDHARSDMRFKALAADLPESPEEPEPLLWHDVSRKKECDLSKADIPDGVTSLLIDACKDVHGWGVLQQFQQLEELTVNLCKGIEEGDLPNPIRIKKLVLDECDGIVTDWLLRNVVAEKLELTYYATPTFDCKRIAHSASLKELRLTAPLIRGLEHLASSELSELMLHHVAANEALIKCLESLKSLSSLDLATTEALAPKLLGGIAANLKLLTLPAWPEKKEAWIQWAAGHPEVGCRFQNLEVTELPTKVPKVEVSQIHRDYSILKLTKGKTIKFELAEDFSDLYEEALSNGDIEERLEPLAKAAKKKITWSSEADTLVATSKKEEDLIWLIDTLLDTHP